MNQSEQLPIFPLNSVLLPNAPLPLRIVESHHKQMLRDSQQNQHCFGVNLVRSGQEVQGVAVPYAVGTEARVMEARELPDDAVVLLAVGGRRYRIEEIVAGTPYIKATIKPVEDSTAPEAQPSRRERELLVGLGQRLIKGAAEAVDERMEELPTDIGMLTWFLAARFAIEPPQRQQLLELTSLRRRVRLLTDFLEHDLPELEEKASFARLVRGISGGNGDVARPR